MKDLFKNIRFYVLFFSLVLSSGIYLYVSSNYPSGNLQSSKFTQIYALTALTYLYFALLASPLTKFFDLPFEQKYLKARRAIGVSSFYFACLHIFYAFFIQLGGFGGLGFLSNKYLIAISFSFTAFLIMAIMTFTAFDFVVAKFSFRKWKIIHRFVYVAGILILIHALMLGTHFSDLSKLIPQIYIFALAFLLVLEAIRLDKFIEQKFKFNFKMGISLFISSSLVFSILFYEFLPQDAVTSLGIHSAHIELAKQNQQGLINPSLKGNLSSIPGLQGDRTKRFTASFSASDNVAANQDVTLKFRIYDAGSGNPVYYFLKLYAWPMHLIISDSTLTTFEHIHPTQQANGEFTITKQFSKPGLYHLYIQFQPAGAIEQQFGFTLPVGIKENETIQNATFPVDTNLTKIFGDYEVTLDTHGALNAQDMTIGNNKLSFTVKDAVTKKPVTTLKPYMAAFGHLSMINEQTYDFIHVHPNSLAAPAPDANGGPTVDFLPIGIYGPIKPGIYRVFGEFSAKVGEDFDSNFTVEVK